MATWCPDNVGVTTTQTNRQTSDSSSPNSPSHRINNKVTELVISDVSPASGSTEDDWLHRKLLGARLQRETFYRRLESNRLRDATTSPPVSASSRDQQVDDVSQGRRGSVRRSVSTGAVTDADDSTTTVPELHSSWRFYTSFDNGEWRRHAVPVHKTEETCPDQGGIAGDVMDEGRSSNLNSVVPSASRARRLKLCNPILEHRLKQHLLQSKRAEGGTAHDDDMQWDSEMANFSMFDDMFPYGRNDVDTQQLLQRILTAQTHQPSSRYTEKVIYPSAKPWTTLATEASSSSSDDEATRKETILNGSAEAYRNRQASGSGTRLSNGVNSERVLSPSSQTADADVVNVTTSASAAETAFGPTSGVNSNGTDGFHSSSMEGHSTDASTASEGGVIWLPVIRVSGSTEQ